MENIYLNKSSGAGVSRRASVNRGRFFAPGLKKGSPLRSVSGMTADREARETRHPEEDAARPHSKHGLSGRDLTALDRAYGPASEDETEVLQNSAISDSEAVDDVDIDQADIKVLPGTGGPDDVGDIEVDPAELNLSGDSIPGHPNRPH